MGDTYVPRFWPPFFTLAGSSTIFWGIFLIHQQQSYLLGYKNYQFLQKSIFLAPNSIFSSIFLGPIFSGQRHTPISFQAEYPPRVGFPLTSRETKRFQLFNDSTFNYDYLHQLWKYICHISPHETARYGEIASAILNFFVCCMEMG